MTKLYQSLLYFFGVALAVFICFVVSMKFADRLGSGRWADVIRIHAFVMTIAQIICAIAYWKIFRLTAKGEAPTTGVSIALLLVFLVFGGICVAATSTALYSGLQFIPLVGIILATLGIMTTVFLAGRSMFSPSMVAAAVIVSLPATITIWGMISLLPPMVSGLPPGVLGGADHGMEDMANLAVTGLVPAAADLTIHALWATVAAFILSMAVLSFRRLVNEKKEKDRPSAGFKA